MPGLSPWADESMVALQWSARPPRSEPLLTTAPDCLAGSSPPSSAPVSPCAPSPQAPSLNARRFSAPVLRVPRRPHAVQHTFLHTQDVGVCMNVCCKIDTSAYCKTRLSVDHPAPLRARLRHPKAGTSGAGCRPGQANVAVKVHTGALKLFLTVGVWVCQDTCGESMNCPRASVARVCL